MLTLLAVVLASCTTAPLSSPPPVVAIRVVMDNNYPPYVFADNQGGVQGILVDQWNLWSKRTGVKVDLVALPWNEALQRMKAGEFDVIDTIFLTEERAALFDFTPPYAQIDVPIFFQKNISGIADAGDLKGFRVAVKSGDANAEYLLSQGITDLVYYNSYEEIVKAAAGREEAIFVIDQPPGLYFLYKYGIQDQFNHSAPLYSGQFHRAVKKGDTALLNLVVDGFAGLSRAEVEAITNRWLGTGETNTLQQLVPYLAIGLALVFLLVFFLVIFNRMLQDRVRQRTRELEEALAALRDSRRFLADLIEYGGALIFVKDQAGRYELINRKWEEVTGLKRAEVIGQTDEVLFPGPTGQQFHANDLAAIEAGTALESEEVLEDARGRRVFISIKFPVRGADGGVTGICGMSTEITERQRAEEARRASEERLRTVTENAPDTILQVNAQGIIYFINRPVPGLTREQIIGSSIYEWVPQEQHPILTRTLEAVFTTGERQDYESLGPGPHGEARTYHVRVMPVMLNGRADSAIYLASDISERKLAEEALREGEEKFRTMIEQAAEGFVLIDEQGIVIEWNRAQERIWGLARAEVLGRPFYDVQFRVVVPERRTPERYESLKAMILTALQTGRSPIFDRIIEGELCRPDGRRVVIQQSIFPIKTIQSYRIGSMSLDITERKQAEAALQASEQKMRAIVDAAPFGAHLYELEPDGHLVFIGANHSADQILHLDHQQFIGKTIEEAFPPLIETEIPAAYRRVATTGERFQLDQIDYDDAGIRGAFELHVFQTGPSQMAVFFRDVTERRKMEEALRVSLEKYRVLFEAFPLGVSITDSAGTILESNLQAEKLLGVPKQEHERRSYSSPEWKIVRADGSPMPVEEYAAVQALQGNRLVQNMEMGVRKDQGDLVWLSVTAAPIPLKGYGVAIAYGDITRSKQVEDELRRLNEELERRVSDRTRELAEANARLTELDQLKSKFVSDVSHELRTPIANLKLYIDLLERGRPEKQAQYITVLQQQVRRVMALVDDILDLSRLERRKEQGVRYRAVPLNEVVDQVVLAHQPRAEADGLALTFEPAFNLPPVRGDANQLAQVITNLVTNALNYTAAGYVRVSTDVRDGLVCLCVADSGSGISPEDLPHLFERFYRGRHVLKNEVPGTGLGLAIVKEIVDLHQGRIEVDSHLGQGTTFRVWLPTVG